MEDFIWVYMFEVMDSYIEIEEGNSQEAKWMRDLASTIMRLFDSLYSDDETIFKNVVQSKRDEYSAIRDRVDGIKQGVIEKAELDSVGSHDGSVSGEEEEKDSDFEDVDSLDRIGEESDGSGTEEKEDVKAIKKKKKTNHGFAGLQNLGEGDIQQESD